MRALTLKRNTSRKAREYELGFKIGLLDRGEEVDLEEERVRFNSFKYKSLFRRGYRRGNRESLREISIR